MKMKKIKEYIPSKWLYVVLFLLPVVFVFAFTDKLDNDIWYLLAEGKYIVQNGIYHIDPLSMHEGLTVTVQNWLSASILYIVHNLFGSGGILFLMAGCNFLICLFLYKICILISDKNKILSLLGMLATDLLIVTHYIVSRPQIFSYVLLLAVIYVLELYIKTDNKKYLRWLPILSIIEANIHGSLWFMIFLFILPYIIDGIKIKELKTEGYNLKPLLIYTGIAAVCGLINPYGYKMITFIFTSFTDHYMHIYINELLPLSISTYIGKVVISISILVALCYAYFRDGHVRVRYLCLFCGTLILSIISVKASSHFILVSLFPLTYFFKDIFPRDFSDLGDSFRQILDMGFKCVTVFLIGLLSYSAYINIPGTKLESEVEVCAKVLKDNYDGDAKVFTTFNLGGHVEYYGLKAYIDPRAEVFLKINNGKDDIFKEFYDLNHDNLSFKELQEKYNFTHAIVTIDESYYGDILDAGFIVLYSHIITDDDGHNIDTKYRVLANKNQFTEEELEYYYENYEKNTDNTMETK